MTSVEVKALLGTPQKTKGAICGEKSDAPWPCLQWGYVCDGWMLSLMFAKVTNDKAWRLLSWESQ